MDIDKTQCKFRTLHPARRVDIGYVIQDFNVDVYKRQIWPYFISTSSALLTFVIFPELFDIIQHTFFHRRSHPEYTPEQLTAAVDDFVALPHPNPARPAAHATGGALDLTLCYRGRLMPMGTEFDDLTNLAQTAYFETNGMAGEAEAFRNTRRLLYNMMTAAGFVNYSEEWWHYSYGDRLWARTFGKTPIYGLCDEKNVE